jgi:hypothetical protein
MKEGLPGGTLSVSPESELEEARFHVARWLGSRSQAAGRLLDRRRGDVVGRLAAAPDADGLRRLVERVGPQARVRGVIESMTGARFVLDTLEALGWEVLVADAQKVKGLAPLACKTNRIDARPRRAVASRSCRRSGCPIRACGASAS